MSNCLCCGHLPGYHEAQMFVPHPCGVKECACPSYVSIEYFDGLQAEVARLRADRDACERVAKHATALLVEREAEVARLRAALAELLDAADESVSADTEDDVAAMLRYGKAVDAARAALGGPPEAR